MNYIKYLAIWTALVFVVSCTESELVEMPTSSSKQIQVAGRVMPFADCNVSSRAIKVGDETNIVSLSLAIFDTNKKCVNLIKSDGSNTVFNIDQTNLQNGYDLYIFANVEFNENLKVGSSLDNFLQNPILISGIDIPKLNGERCFPMMGKLENYNSTTNAGSIIEIPLTALFSKIVVDIEVRPDQQIAENIPPRFILHGYEVYHVASSVDFIGGTANSTNDRTQTLSDKFQVAIESNNVAQGSNSVQFSFYLPERFLKPNTTAAEYNYPFKKNGSIRKEDEIYRQRFKPCLVEDNNPPATFVRFLGEYIDHQGHRYEVSYDVYVGNDNYSNFDIERNTQYNNYITIRGLANSQDQTDYNENLPESTPISIDHRVNVRRTQPAIINLRRETLLDSHFEVRPLRISKSDVGDVSDINAVKVEIVNPTITNWMRLERSAGEGTTYKGKTNEKGQSIYITDEGPSKGKRRYFTYNLVNGVTPGTYDYSLVNSTEVVLPLSANTECCWIYVDECLEVGDGVRSGLIKVSYGNLNGATFTPANDTNFPDVYYHINQRKLFQVRGTKSYNIEYHEEYLYNYDADDNYGQTVYEGMVWGLEGLRLSYDHPALYFKSYTSSDIGDLIVNFFKGDTPAFYDFYIKSHDEGKVDPRQIELHEYVGYEFCKEIIQVVNGGQKDNDGKAYDTDPDNNIDILQLDQQPRSAIEYCYNKNKRNNIGQVVWQNGDSYNESQLNWYLPAIDEIEDIVMSEYGNGQKTYARFLEFQAQDYWSCQPAYIQNYAHVSWLWGIMNYWGTFYYDDIGDTSFDINNNTDRARIGSARSTSVKYAGGSYQSTSSGTNGYYSFYEADDKEYSYSGTKNGVTIGTISREEGNQPRNVKNRIRCVRK